MPREVFRLWRSSVPSTCQPSRGTRSGLVVCARVLRALFCAAAVLLFHHLQLLLTPNPNDGKKVEYGNKWPCYVTAICVKENY